MALESKLVSFNIGTAAATTEVSVTGVGFIPKAIIFYWSGRTESVDTAGRATHRRGVGMATSATNRIAWTTTSVDAVTTSDTGNDDLSDCCIATIRASDKLDQGKADLVSMDADGFTLVIDTQFAVDLRIHALCIGGSDITNANIFSITEPGSAAGNTTHNGAGFQGDCFFFLGGMRLPSQFDEAMSFGVGHSSGQFVVLGGGQDAAATSNTDSNQNSSECYIRSNPGHSELVARAAFVSSAADGVVLDWLESNTAVTFFCLALKGGQYHVGNLLTQTDTTTAMVESGFGFSPASALFVSTCHSESTQDVRADHDIWSMGAFSDATTRGAMGIIDADAQADTVVASIVEHDAVYIDHDGTNIVGLMDVQSVDADGFTMIMDDADPAQRFVGYVAFGSEPETGNPIFFGTHF